MPLVVRRIRVSDLPVLDAIENEITARFASRAGWMETYRNLLDIALAKEPEGVLVADFDGRPIGAAIARVAQNHRVTGQKHGVVEAITVAPAWKPQGIAERLLKESEMYLKSRGCEIVTVSIPESMGSDSDIYKNGNYRVIAWELEKSLK
jgi:ribosomal protein S18 acetylase RimI-like enzyme